MEVDSFKFKCAMIPKVEVIEDFEVPPNIGGQKFKTSSATIYCCLCLYLQQFQCNSLFKCAP